MNRRHLMLGCCGAMAAGLFTGLSSPAQAALRNPCRGPLPPNGPAAELLAAALQGLDATRLLDSHMHLLGTGDSGSGCTVHPSMHQWWRPTEVLRRKAILNAACVDEDTPSIDRAYVQRLQQLGAEFPVGSRWWLFAFDQACDDGAQPRPEWTTFHVPNAYTAQVAKQLSAAGGGRRFEWVASVHPYRVDALTQLKEAVQQGAVAVKWLPSAMNIDPRDPRSRRFAQAAASAGLPLIVHCGEEKAVPGAGRDELGNPLLVRPLLEQGCRVIVAHCASLGQALDTDRPSAPKVPAFDLFVRLMDEPAWQGRLLGDISAVFQRNRKPEVWRAVVQRQDWHGRLLHGSDHPLPGLMPLFSVSALHAAGLLAEADMAPLQNLREHNALLFDLALKRRLRLGESRLAASVFEAKALT